MTTAAQQAAIAALAADLRENDYADALVVRDFAREMREFSPLNPTEIEDIIQDTPGAVIVFADPASDLPPHAFPVAGVILDADGAQITA